MQLLTALLASLCIASASSKPSVDPVSPFQAAKAPLLILNFPATSALPNPQSLPARTLVTLSTANLTLSAYFRRDSTFVFNDIPLGSYLGEVWTGAAGVNTVPLRIDVAGPDGSIIAGETEVLETEKKVSVWQTFRANEWDNKGELLGEGTGTKGLTVNVQVLSVRDVFEPRGGFSPMSLLKNPMILMGVVAMAMMFGMPKLMANMDPEMREEFEKQQRATGLANALTGQGSTGFDAASWLAGSGSKDSTADTPSRNSAAGRSSGVEGKGGKKRRA